MHASDHQRLLIKISKLYYEQEQTQSQISKRLRISRQKVQRMLKEARQEGIVQLSIRPLMGVFDDQERALEESFGLREVIIAEISNYKDHDMVTREIGAAAAEFLLRILQANDTLAISWGSSLLGMVNALNASNRRIEINGIQIVQGLGGLGDPTNETHAAELTRRLASVLDGQGILLPAPGIVGSQTAGEVFKTDPHVKHALQTAASANLAFMGIGAPRQDSILIQQGKIVEWEELKLLKDLGAIGDINLRYFDSHGSPIESDLDGRVIGLSLEEIHEIDTVVGIAGGEEKFNAILGAVKGQVIDVLVTDHITAHKLLNDSAN
jgi:DNA-binding transcriptional regulator LsrR (DeoR family)